jgi:hypothetical protein
MRKFNLWVGSIIIDQVGGRDILESQNLDTFCFDTESDYFCSVSIFDNRCFVDVSDIYAKLRKVDIHPGSYKMILFLNHVKGDGDNHFCNSGFLMDFVIQNKHCFVSNPANWYLQFKYTEGMMLDNYGLGNDDVYTTIYIIENSVWDSEISVLLNKSFNFIRI